jgi:hypothetical protein
MKGHMEELRIEASEHNPEIHLDPDNGVFRFIGRSVPEDAIGFFEPVMEWIERYAEAPGERTDLVIKIEYFNTRSSKVFLDIMRKMEGMQARKGGEVRVHWYYDEEDEEMKEVGEEYGEMLSGITFRMVPEKEAREEKKEA